MYFGVIATKNTVTGTHPSIGGDNAVIRSSDGHTCSEKTHRSTQSIKSQEKKKAQITNQEEREKRH